MLNPTSLFLSVIGASSGSIMCHVIAFGTDVGNHSPSRTKHNRSILLHDVNTNTDPLVPLHEEYIDQSPLPSDYYSSYQVSSRKQFLSTIITTTSTVPFLGAAHFLFSSPPPANADEPSNLYYRSKSDGEDPLVVFGKSLENGIVDPSSSSNILDNDPSILTFSDFSLPSTTTTKTTTTTSDTASSTVHVGGDLNKALQKKVEESQTKRAINPLTHG